MIAMATATHYYQVMVPRAKQQSLLCLIRLLQPARRNLVTSAGEFMHRYPVLFTECLEVLARLGRAVLLVLPESFQCVGKLGALAELEVRMRRGRHRAQIDVKECQ